MQSEACHRTYCKFCGKPAWDGKEVLIFKDNQFLESKYIFKHFIVKSDNVLFCDENNKRKAKLYDKDWKSIKKQRGV